jgi:hypothetical protein
MIYGNMKVCGAALRLAAMAAVAALTGLAPEGALAQASIYAQDATVSANAATVSGQYLPVVTSSGTSYYNFTTTITVGASGVPTATTVFSASPTLLFVSLQAGTYASGSCTAMLTGPGIGPNGTTEWTWSSNCVPYSAAFYVGAISSNPLASRIKKAKITYTGYSYGLAGSGISNWGSDCLLGIAQTGGAITLVSFSNGSCSSDSSIPQAQESWKLSSP